MKLFLIALVALPLAAQTRLKAPTTAAGWKAHELPQTAQELRDRLTTLNAYCVARDGLKLGTGAVWVLPGGTEVVAHSHPSFSVAYRATYDADGNVLTESGGDRILVINKGLDDRLSGKLCIPRMDDATDRRLLKAMIGPLLAAGTARFVRRIPAGWTAKGDQL